MKNKRNIYDIINARELARKLIDVDPKNKGKSLQVPNLVLIGFNKYLEDNKGLWQNVFGMSNKYISEKVLEYTHSSKADNAEDAYMEKRFKGDFSQCSFYDSLERIISKKKKIANCLGFTSIDKFLLEAKGVDSRVVKYEGHVSLEIRNKRKFIHLETTMINGYKHKNLDKRLNDTNLISIVVKGLGNSYADRGNYSEAIDAYTKAIRINPKNESAYISQGVALCDLHEHELAILDYTKAIELNPENDTAYFNRGFSLSELQKHELAILDYTKAIELNPKNEEVYVNRGVCLRKIGKIKLAILDYTKVLELNPKDEYAYFNRGNSFDFLGEYNKSLHDFKKYASFSSKNAEEVKDKIEYFENKLKEIKY